MIKNIISLFVFTLFALSVSAANLSSTSNPLTLVKDSVTSITSLSKGGALYFSFPIPKNSLNLSLTLTGTNGDADIYLNKDKLRTSKTSTWRSAKSSSNEKITIARPVAGTYYLTVLGYEASSNLSLTLTYTDAVTGAQTLVKQVPLTVASMAQDEEKLFTFTLPSSSPNLVITTSGTEGDVDIYLNKDTIRSTKLSTYKSTGDTSDERIVIPSAVAGTYYLSLRAYTPTTNTVVTMDYGTPVPVSISGSCGTSANQTLTSSPVNLCTTGSASSITTTDTSYTWACSSTNGGTTASCSASKPVTVTPTPVVVNGSCGTSANQTLATAPTTNLCATGTASSVTSGTSYTWSCSGGSGVSCSSNKVVAVSAATSSWVFVIRENSSFTLVGTQTVRYGSGSSWIQKTLSGTVQCTNTFFGSDPLFGIGKQCEVLTSNGSTSGLIVVAAAEVPSQAQPVTGTSSSISKYTVTLGDGVSRPIANTYAPTWSFCTRKYYDGCSFSGLREIRFGDGNKWVVKRAYSGFGGSSCHPDNFGVPYKDQQAGDHCEVSNEVITGTLMTPTTAQHGGSYPTIDLTSIPLGYEGTSTLIIKPTSDFGTTSDIGAFRIPCIFSHMAFNDPIVYLGQPGQSHLHTFFGNTAVNAFSTAASIAASTNSTCAGGSANHSSYWVPTIIDTLTGKPIAPTGALWYYKTGYDGVLPKDVKPFPAGLRMITGDMHATTTQDAIVRFDCSAAQLRSGVIPNCPAGTQLDFTISFPRCWDGVNLDSPNHKSHMAFGTGKGCPSTHPVALPLLSLNIHYDVKKTGETLNWRFSSDHNGMPSGYSAHADFFEGWTKDLADTFVKNCLNASKDCHAYLLGNGTTLEF
jgi:hypothetical protein